LLDKEARRRSLEGLEIRALDESRVGEAVDVVARGMRDNPMHLAAYGEDPERRLRKVHRFVSAAFAVKDFSHSLVARRADGAIVGVGGVMPPGDCLPTLG
jgi:ribosomal protein S18 acetylase RimI-like enzyme